jgi:DNA-binding transcriptional MerR regulator
VKRLRPVDLAREHGLSPQAVRNYEEAGILPVAERTPTGYRIYTPLHAQALRAFTALVPGHGHQTATAIMTAVNEGRVADALALVDESHTRLLEDRRTLSAVEAALRELTAAPEPPGGTYGGRGGGETVRRDRTRDETSVGPLARRLGLRPATLRKWERAGLVRPRRDPRTGYRVYTDADVRDARLAHQLRRGGYLLRQIAPLLDRVREAGGVEPLRATLDEWRGRLDARGRALLAGAAELDAYLRQREPPARTPADPARRTPVDQT